MEVPDGTRVRATKAMADSLSDLVRTVWERMRRRVRRVRSSRSRRSCRTPFARGKTSGKNGYRCFGSPNPDCRKSRRSGWSASCRGMLTGKGRRFGTRPKGWCDRRSMSSSSMHPTGDAFCVRCSWRMRGKVWGFGCLSPALRRGADEPSIWESKPRGRTVSSSGFIRTHGTKHMANS